MATLPGADENRRAERRDTVMLPFTQVAVPAIDVAGGRIVVAADAFAVASDASQTLPREPGRGSAG